MRNKWAEWVGDRLERQSFIFSVTAAVLVIVYLWHLGSVPLSGAETNSIKSAGSLHSIYLSPLNAPHQLLQYLLIKLNHSGPFVMRSVSVAFGLLFIYCSYAILRHWFGRFSAWLGAVFFAATPLMMLASRSATGTIMLLFPLALTATYMKTVRNKDRLFARGLVMCLLTALALYQPAGILFVILGAVYVRSTIGLYSKQLTRTQIAACTALFIIAILPLILAVVRDAGLAKSLCLVPQSFAGVVEILKSCTWSLLAYVWHSGTHNDNQVGRLAILNAAQIILLVFGVYAMWSRARQKVYVLAGGLLLAIIAAGLNSRYNLLLLGLPLLSLVITAGLRYLHLEWTSVFPRNPLPRGLAIFLLVAVVVVHLAWGAHYSLTAWPHSLVIH